MGKQRYTPCDESISIVPLTTVEQFKTCEKLQQEIWQADPIDIIPVDILVTAQRHGGIILGAFDLYGEMIGCLFGFTGYTAVNDPLTPNHRLQHCSHFLGVSEKWRNKGVGFLLKRKQHEWASRQGYDWITWTYNPLEIANATLSIGKLGAMSRCYLPDLYGVMPNKLNEGLHTDRLEVVWDIRSEHVIKRLGEGWRIPSLKDLVLDGSYIINSSQVINDKWIGPSKTIKIPEGRQILIEIPTNFQDMREANLNLAIDWQLHVRYALETSFRHGYTICDIVKTGDITQKAYYLLRNPL